MQGSSDRTTVEGLHGLAEAVRSLNDIVSELVAGLAAGETPSKGYAYVTVQTLAEHTRELGGDPSLTEHAFPEWEGQNGDADEGPE